MRLEEFTMNEALINMPEILELDFEQSLDNKKFDFFISALGFEERTLSIPTRLTSLSNFTCEEAIYLTYNTSTNDNAFNEPPLRSAFAKIKNSAGAEATITNMHCDNESFIQLLTEKIQRRCTSNSVKVLLDLSVCSSKLILMLMKVLLDIKEVELTIVYTEADIYFPLFSEYDKHKEKFEYDSDYTSTRGYEKTINSNEYSEGSKENPDLIVAFAPFKAGRINRIVSEIDESILLNSYHRLVWIIGHPNFDKEEDSQNRMLMLKEINGISDEDCRLHDVGTLNYKEIISVLENIYQENSKYHMNIADLGSKMQTLGISIFYHIRPDVSVYYAIPQEYNSHRYSTGVKKHWIIEFRSIKDLISLISKVDNITIKYELNEGFDPFKTA